MLTRRALLAGTALTALAPMIPTLVASAAPVPDAEVIDWVVYAASFTPAQAYEKYREMTRNCGPEHLKLIEAPGPLSDGYFYRSRQAMYRRSCEAI
jgi:hypothetical protein